MQKRSTKKERRRSYILTDEQLAWLGKAYPLFNNEDLSRMIFERYGIRMSRENIKDMAKRNVWYKDKEEISRERRKNAMRTNNKRWGTPLDEED